MDVGAEQAAEDGDSVMLTPPQQARNNGDHRMDLVSSDLYAARRSEWRQEMGAAHQESIKVCPNGLFRVAERSGDAFNRLAWDAVIDMPSPRDSRAAAAANGRCFCPSPRDRIRLLSDPDRAISGRMI